MEQQVAAAIVITFTYCIYRGITAELFLILTVLEEIELWLWLLSVFLKGENYLPAQMSQHLSVSSDLILCPFL